MASEDEFVSWDQIKTSLVPTDPDERAEYQRAYREAGLATMLAELVYHLRKEAGITQQELAARMGTTQSAISRMENFGTLPTFDIMSRVGTALGVQLSITYGDGKQVPLNVA